MVVSGSRWSGCSGNAANAGRAVTVQLMSGGVPPSVRLLVGPQELLLRRAADRLLDELRAVPGAADLEVSDVRAAEIRERGMPDLQTASLFGARRALVIRDAQDLPAAAAAALLAELKHAQRADAAVPETTVVLLATGTGRIRALAAALKEAGGRIDVAPPREWEDRKWAELVADEFRLRGRRAEREAVAAILQHAGLDVATVAEKVAQAAASAPAGVVTAEAVQAVVVGHGSRGSFAVADAMCDRRPAEAIALLRGVLEGGDDPVMVLGALVYRLRSLVAVAGHLDGRSVGVNVGAGQMRRLQGIRRNFGPGELTAAYRTLAQADRDLKGGDLPPAFVLERAVAAVAAPSR